MVRAIRGATTVEENTEQEILNATCELLKTMMEVNGTEKDNIISIIFSVTMDLNAAFPAVAARRLGWTETALMSTYEINVPGSLQKCIRVMMHINTEKKNSELKFVYQKQARLLRPDLMEQNQQTGG
jgi:chorismate mutase